MRFIVIELSFMLKYREFPHGSDFVEVIWRREIVCLGCISETVRCRKLILGRDIG